MTWAVLEKWQGLIGTLVGFAGVVVTLAVNAHLQRTAEARREATEKRGLRSALLSEMLYLILAVRTTIDLGKAVQPFADIKTPILDASIGKVGLLDVDAAFAVVDAYWHFRQAQTVGIKLRELIERQQARQTSPEVLAQAEDAGRELMTLFRNTEASLCKAVARVAVGKEGSHQLDALLREATTTGSLTDSTTARSAASSAPPQ